MERVKQVFTKGSSSDSPERPTCVADQMKAITWHGWHGSKNIKVECVEKPKLVDSSDVVVKVSVSSICPRFATQLCAGDISSMQKGQILGHEAVGVVHRVGSNVAKVKEGDRVLISSVVACGKCSFCRCQEYSSCNRTNESKEFADKYGGWAPAAMFGGSQMLGNLPGCNAEYVRVPFGDVNCFKVPNGVPDEKAVFLSNTVVMGLHAAELGHVKEDDVVVIWGLGPVSLMVAQWCKLKGAKRVIGVDDMADRVNFAHDKFRVEVVDRSTMSSAQLQKQLMDMMPDGGADVVIDAWEYSCHTSMKEKLEHCVGIQKEKGVNIKECFTIARKLGTVVMLGDYTEDCDAFPLGHLVMKQLTLRSGRCPGQKYMKKAMNAVEAGEIDPSMLISHRVGLDELPELYVQEASKNCGYMKVLCTHAEN